MQENKIVFIFSLYSHFSAFTYQLHELTIEVNWYVTMSEVSSYLKN